MKYRSRRTRRYRRVTLTEFNTLGESNDQAQPAGHSSLGGDRALHRPRHVGAEVHRPRETVFEQVLLEAFTTGQIRRYDPPEEIEPGKALVIGCPVPGFHFDLLAS